MDLINKVALITGGTQGIGAETAIKLAKQGVKISLVARDIGNISIKEEIEAMGEQCLVISADLVKERECKRVVAERRLRRAARRAVEGQGTLGCQDRIASR